MPSPEPKLDLDGGSEMTGSWLTSDSTLYAWVSSCALSEWGYNGLREVEEARRRGYRVLRLESLEAQLFDG